MNIDGATSSNEGAAVHNKPPHASDRATENGQLCWKCQGLLNSQYPREVVYAVEEYSRIGRDFMGRKLKTSDSIEKTAGEGCPLCQRLLHAMPVSMLDALRCLRQKILTYEYSLYLRKGNPGSLSLIITSDDEAEQFLDDNEIKCLVELYPASEVKNCFNHGEIENRTDSNTTWSLISTWFKQCDGAHKRCAAAMGDPKPLPSRVIDVTPGQPPKLLIVGNSTKLARYATLSHCWGSHMPLRLLSSNIATLQDEIPFSHLTKTFQDAIIACRRLGIHYLWADSLCIIQDSNQDWEEQCVMMSQVYSNSYCNIAAAHARDGSFGCFARRDPATVQPLNVDLNWGHSPGAHYVVWTRYWTERVLETPLNMRAWVFQERTLAPRNLFFGATEVFFECLENRASEHFPVQIPRQVGAAVLRGIRPHIDGPLIRETLGLEPDQSLDALSLWGHLVERFSLGRLTYATDKLVALSAIASEMQGHIQSDYLAGMWRRHLGCQLLWDVRGIQWLVQRSRPSAFVAPSWSWASVVGVVQNACSVRFADDRGIIIEILDAQINLANPKNHFGQVIGGFLRVRGSLAKSRVLMQKSPSGSEFLYLSISKGASSSVVFDNAQENSTAIGEEFYLLPIQHLPHNKEVIWIDTSIAIYDTSGIILRQTCPSKEEYIRVGKFEEFGDLEEFQSACRETASWTGDGEEAADGWGPKRVLTIL